MGSNYLENVAIQTLESSNEELKRQDHFNSENTYPATKWGDCSKKGDFLMASNFQLFLNQNRDSLHFHMSGDFDGISACELINALEKQNIDYFEVFIDTNDLNKIHAFGIDVFQKKVNLLSKNNRNLIFIGKHRSRFAA